MRVRKYKRKDGYIMVSMIETEHVLIFMEHFGPIPEGFDVHHKNGIRDDNRIENLELLSKADHRRRHSKAYQQSHGEEWKKVCTLCGKTKELDEFYKRRRNKEHKDYILTHCKDCEREKMKSIRLKDPGRIKRYQKTWYDNHPDKVKEAAARQAADPVQKARRSKQDKLRWLDPVLRAAAQARLKIWQKANRDKIREYNARARAKRIQAHNDKEPTPCS